MRLQFFQVINIVVLFLMITISLFTDLFHVSDRCGFHDPDCLSKVQRRSVLVNGKDIDAHEWIPAISNKKVVILIHGYNNEYKAALAFSDNLYRQTKELYDTHISYLWPSGNHFWEYFFSKSFVTGEQLPKRLLSLFMEVTSFAKQVDIIAHSMGCRLALEALSFPEKINLNRLYLFAPAIDNEALEREETYHAASQKCKEVYVFHSKSDLVVTLGYPILEWDLALGSSGPECVKCLSSNVRLFDSTDIIDRHSGYFNHPGIYSIIADSHLEHSLNSH